MIQVLYLSQSQHDLVLFPYYKESSGSVLGKNSLSSSKPLLKTHFIGLLSPSGDLTNYFQYFLFYYHVVTLFSSVPIFYFCISALMLYDLQIALNCFVLSAFLIIYKYQPP